MNKGLGMIINKLKLFFKFKNINRSFSKTFFGDVSSSINWIFK